MLGGRVWNEPFSAVISTQAASRVNDFFRAAALIVIA
jgi:hypothetical protein